MLRKAPLMVLLWLASVLASSPATALTPHEVARRLAETYGVDVLRVRELEEDGRRLYAVTVMLPGGNRNDAFQVGTLLLDAETGEPVPRFGHGPSGHELPPPVKGSVPEPTGDQIRERTFGRQ